MWGALQQTLYRDVDYLKSVLLNCWNQVSQDTVSTETDQLLKILTAVIRAKDMLNVASYSNIYDININCEFKMIRMQKMNVIAKISRYFSACLLYTSPSPRDRTRSRMPSSA